MKLSLDDIEFILECIGERAKKEKDNIDYSHYEEYKKFADRYSNILIELEEEKDRIEKRKNGELKRRKNNVCSFACRKR